MDLAARGISAGTYQHEVDHLDGKIFVDRVTDPSTFSTWDNFDRHHRDRFVEYAQAIVARHGG
jgi:peptide deformylase